MRGIGFCPGCGAPTIKLTEICPKCGARVAGLPGAWEPTAAGVIDIIVGVGYEVFCAVMAMEDLIFAGVLFILGIVVIAGGISNLQRKNWGLALTGSICALGGGILGILAIWFTAEGKKHFKS